MDPAPSAARRPAAAPDAAVPVRIWDLPTRVFHWLLAAAVVALVVTAKLDALVWHMRLGLAVGALLVFRVVWGLVGGRWSRFASFVRSPGAAWRHLRGADAGGPAVGHNPLGAYSVVAMLAVLVVQVATGLVADDDVGTTGPLNRFASSAQALAATGWHKHWGQWLVIGLVALHVGAIVAYAVRGRRLVPAMLHGDAPAPAGTAPSRDDAASRLLALAVAAACGAGAVAVARLGG